MDALVEVHDVDWQACGLEGYGKPTGYLERQLRRFTGLWEHNKTRELEVVEELGEWLRENMPESPESTIVHGDYRLGNVMMADSAPAELVAIFDWELSTIGDPLADVGYLTVTWVEPDDPEDTMFANLNAVTRREGFLTREELIARYEERTGRSVSALNWYQALALWKAAVFMEGNYKRFQAGNSDDEYLGAVRPRRADAGREGAGDRALDEGPAGRLRRRPHHERLRLLPGLLRGRGARPRGDQAALPRGPARARVRARAGARRAVTRRTSPSASASCSSSSRSAAAASWSGCSATSSRTRRWSRRCAARARRACAPA